MSYAMCVCHVFTYVTLSHLREIMSCYMLISVPPPRPLKTFSPPPKCVHVLSHIITSVSMYMLSCPCRVFVLSCHADMCMCGGVRCVSWISAAEPCGVIFANHVSGVVCSCSGHPKDHFHICYVMAVMLFRVLTFHAIGIYHEISCSVVAGTRYAPSNRSGSFLRILGWDRYQ